MYSLKSNVISNVFFTLGGSKLCTENLRFKKRAQENKSFTFCNSKKLIKNILDIEFQNLYQNK